jgi:hypothetical protein
MTLQTNENPFPNCSLIEGAKRKLGSLFKIDFYFVKYILKVVTTVQ